VPRREPQQDPSDFPTRILAAGTALHRIYRAGRPPWWFSCDGSGVTGELIATADYTLPHSWARRLDAAGFTAAHYRIRHDPRADLTGIAWFGRAGRWSHPSPSTRQLPSAGLLLDAAPFGIRVATDL